MDTQTIAAASLCAFVGCLCISPTHFAVLALLRRAVRQAELNPASDDAPTGSPQIQQSTLAPLAVGLPVGLVALYFSVGWGRGLLLVWWLIPFALMVAILDSRTRKIPNPLTLGGAILAVVMGTLAWVLGPDADATVTSWSGAVGWNPAISIDPSRLAVHGILGALVLSSLFAVGHWYRPTGIGRGDVKCALVCGAALGMIDPIILPWATLLSSALMATVTGLAVVGRRGGLAFGPFLGGATVVVLCFQQPILALLRPLLGAT